MNVILVEPSFPDNQKQFARSLAEVGATVIGIGERSKESLDDDVKGWLTHYEQVGSVVDEGALFDAVRRVQGMVWVDRLEATVEAHIMPAARVREACHIPGTSERTAFLCRDKPAMKEALRAAGVRCAQSTGATSAAEVWSFAAQVGYPLILKPAAGAGAAGATRVNAADELAEAISRSGVDHGVAIAVEEYVEGHEGFYDTISSHNRVVHDWTTHYYPNVLEAMRTRWISPQFITTNRQADSPFYAEVTEMGQRVIEALDIGTSATHMEWFHGPKGLKFSEIGARPPGVGAWDLYSAANDVDVYREWAHIITHGSAERRMTRRYSAGIVALRPERDGHITGYSGIDEIQGRHGQWIIDGHFPPAGHFTQAVEAGYMANAYVRMRHPDYDALRGMLDDVGRTVQVHAS